MAEEGPTTPLLFVLAVFRIREIYKPFYEGKKFLWLLLFCLRSLIFQKKGDPLMAKLERDFQANLIKELKTMFPGCIVMKNDASYIQGIPDLLILHNDKWASLECKKNASAKKQPNQDYYVNRMNEMSFSRIIYPENKEEILHELQSTLEP
jgi:hypothetical protein